MTYCTYCIIGREYFIPKHNGQNKDNRFVTKLIEVNFELEYKT